MMLPELRDNTLVWQAARVVESAPDQIRVEFDMLRGCQACLRGQGCGAGIFSRLLPMRAAGMTIDMTTDLDKQFEVGQRVRVGVQSDRLLLASIVLYALPLLAFLAGAGLGHWLAGSDPWRDPLALIMGLLAAGAALGLPRLGMTLPLNPQVRLLSCTASQRALESAPQ